MASDLFFKAGALFFCTLLGFWTLMQVYGIVCKCEPPINLALVQIGSVYLFELCFYLVAGWIFFLIVLWLFTIPYRFSDDSDQNNTR
jgi:hypothetical protein